MSKVILPPAFGLLALFLLLFKLPGFPELFGIFECKSCSTTSPYIPMLGGAYFAALIVTNLCFPSHPLKVAGLIWAIGLAVTMTYLSPFWCPLCLGAHACHVLIWMFWKPTPKRTSQSLGLRLSLVFTASLSVMALFSTLNITFLVYGVKMPSKKVEALSMVTVDDKLLTADMLSGYAGVVLDFVSANCLYCKEQLPRLDALIQELPQESFRYIAVTHRLAPDLQHLGPHFEWVEDTQGALAEKFGIQGFPTMVVIDSKGAVVKRIPGAASKLEKEVSKQLTALHKESEKRCPS